jgi:pentatricopeptide repeat protein
MQNTGMPVNLITYNACITALSKASRQYARHSSENTSNEISLWKRASSLLKHMKEDGIEPDGFSYSAAISCCGAEGRWEEALELMEQMRQGGARTRPNKVSYTAAITACGRAGKAEDAIRLFRIMKKEGLSPDRIAYNALFSALRVAGDSETVSRLSYYFVPAALTLRKLPHKSCLVSQFSF